MKFLFWSVLTIELAAYLYLGWITFFSQYDPHIPVPYIILHIVAAIHSICLLVVLVTFFFQRPSPWLRNSAIILSLPSIVTVIVLFAINMSNRWF
jgi:hypothetical protein